MFLIKKLIFIKIDLSLFQRTFRQKNVTFDS